MLYHKIDGPFKRNPENLKEVLWGEWRNPTVEMLAYSPIWVASEKIDGTNIRVEWDGHEVSFGGRTDNAQIPQHLLSKLQEQWHRPGVEELFEELFGEKYVTIFGEGFGPKIQSGGNYGPSVDFIAFDVSVNGTYLAMEDASSIVEKFDAKFLPQYSERTLNEYVKIVQKGFPSHFGDVEPEGLVARTKYPLYDQRGNRIIVKLKEVDLQRHFQSHGRN